MSEAPVIDVDVVLAAIVNDCNGYLEVTEESIMANYAESALSISYNEANKSLVIQLVDRDVVEYEDE